jgi:hypothetical protein
MFFLLVLVCALLGGVIWAGRLGLEHLRGSDRYDVKFADIECAPPAGMAKQAFLDEVQYESQLPEHLHLLDDDLRQRLQDGFAKHPWVEKVAAVEIKPPKQIVIQLVHRTPVLAVKAGAKTHAVDGFGVLLPANAPTLGLPIYDGEAKPPRVLAAGTPFGDPNVEALARKLKK